MKIGFFDSGLGGLTIMRSVVTELPMFDYVYFGDTKNLPYEDKSEEEVYAMTVEGIRYLFEADCSVVIIACNSASAETARKLQNEFLPEHYPDRKILGITIPTVEEILGSGFADVALLGTKRTIESEKYTVELDRLAGRSVNLLQISTPELVPLIELGEIEAAAKQAIVRIDKEASESSQIVLACTHYTQIKGELRDHYKQSKNILSQDELIPSKLKEYLEAHSEIRDRLTDGGVRSVHLTKHPPDYDSLVGQFLGGVFVG